MDEPWVSPDERRRRLLRWLLRPLAEPAFFRYYLEPDPPNPYPPALFEALFFGLSTDTEHREDDRARAWACLREWVAETTTPAAWFHAILTKLSAGGTDCAGGWVGEDAAELSHYCALPELFSGNVASVAPRLDSYHEIHCHLRGAVPFLALWRRFLTDDRTRVNLRERSCTAGNWTRPWAEIVEDLAPLHDHLSRPAEEEPELIRRLAREIRETGPCTDATRYLAACATLRRTFLYRRGRVGLSDFVIAYDGYSKLQKGSPGAGERKATREHVVAILDTFAEDGAVAVELRPTLEDRPADLRDKLTPILLGYFEHVAARDRAGKAPVLLGLVPSLFKQQHLKGRDPDAGLTWDEQGSIWLRQVEILLDAIVESPALRHFVVGIDAAGRERGCPPRALAPAFAEVRRRTAQHALGLLPPGREMSVRWMKELARTAVPADWLDVDRSHAAVQALNRAFVPPIRLGLTVHAGEDFEDPITGLRHIHESVCALELRAGDRIGHAIAVALDEKLLLDQMLSRRQGRRGTEVERLSPARAERASSEYRIRKPRGTHLLDLAWALEMLACVGADAEIRARVAALLGEAAAASFGHPADPARLGPALRAAGATARPMLPGVRFEDPRELHPEDWTWVRVDQQWRGLFENLRQRVLTLLIEREIVIESCPTSNIVVANLRDPPLDVLASVPRLRCALATDDPGLFGRFPANEMHQWVKTSHVAQRLLDVAAQASFVRVRACD